MFIDIKRSEGRCTLLVEFANGQTATINVLDEVIEPPIFPEHAPVVLPPVIIVSDRMGDRRHQFA